MKEPTSGADVIILDQTDRRRGIDVAMLTRALAADGQAVSEARRLKAEEVGPNALGDEQSKTLVVLGDSTFVHAAVTACMQADVSDKTTLVVDVDAGGSDLARTYGLTGGLDDLVQRCRAATTVGLDVGVIADTDETVRGWFVAGISVHAKPRAADPVAASGPPAVRIARTMTLGMAKLATATAQAAIVKPVDIDFELDHAQQTIRGTSMIVANAQHLDGRVVAPRALSDDGVLNVQMWSGGRADLLNARVRLARADHLALSTVREWQSATVSVRTPGLQITADGTEAGQTPAAFSLERSRLRLAL